MTTVHIFNGGIDVNKVVKAACFDLDWTLIRPQNTKFPRTYDDNVIMNNRIQVLKRYIEDGYHIIIFTNQKLTNKENLNFKISRMNDIFKKFKDEGIDVIILMSTAEDKYRKPNTGMWEEFKKLCPNLQLAFYCGDAAGRPNDFSDSDLKFAENIKINFYTPEKAFGV
jgi:DNA 3'-phosphatase